MAVKLAYSQFVELKLSSSFFFTDCSFLSAISIFVIKSMTTKSNENTKTNNENLFPVLFLVFVSNLIVINLLFDKHTVKKACCGWSDLIKSKNSTHTHTKKNISTARIL